MFNVLRSFSEGLTQFLSIKYKVCSSFGIPIYFSLPFLMFFGILGVQLQSAGHLEYLVYVYLAYKCVVLHEIGHALAAKYFGYKVDDITLYPFMGIARIDIPWDNPRAEFWITLCGPLVNLILAYLVLPLVFIFPSSVYLDYILVMNLGLFAFNMLIMLPMDGGRLLRSSLGVFLTPINAATVTIIVSSIVFPFALFVFAYCLGSYQILFLAPFIYASAIAEYVLIRRENSTNLWRLHEAEKALVKGGMDSDRVNVIAYAGYLEFLELATKVVMDLFIPLKATTEEIKDLLMKIFPAFVKDGEYDKDHAHWSSFEKYWSAPSSMRKYIVADIVTDVLHDDYELFLKKANDAAV